MFRLRPSSLSFVSMPTYDYRCPNGHDFEHFYRKISDATAELACPQCGLIATRRVSGGAGLVFKGSGFYLTDYGKNAHRKSGGADASSSGGSSSGGESKGESSSESKSSGKSESAKSDGASTSAKSEGSSTSSTKSDSGKSSDGASSSKPKGGESQ